MAFFTDITAQISAMRDLVGDALRADELPTAVSELDDESVVALLRTAAATVQEVEQLTLVAAGVVARRSQRSAGHSGLAQSRGHRNSTSLIQEITGTSRSDASRQARVGESLLGPDHCDDEHEPPVDGEPEDSSDSHVDGQDADDKDAEAAPGSEDSPGADDAPAQHRERRWDDPLRHALFAGTITGRQHDAIRRGLGEPPAPAGASDAVITGFQEAWCLAAEQLIEESQHRTLEELRSTARTIRDQLDPEGAEARFLERHAARSFRLWTDADGRHRASAVFDDEGFLWLQTLMNAALRPRRGGPRFVDAEEKSRAAELADDPRTNDQLAYDLILDVLRAGAIADAETVFGTKQPGVRLVQPVDAEGSATGPTLAEDGLVTMPAAAAAQRICDTGSLRVTVDGRGNPLGVGREHRLFTAKQRIALAIRDGGCRWKNCDRPASYCEAHT